MSAKVEAVQTELPGTPALTAQVAAQSDPYDGLVIAAKDAFRACLKARGTKASRAVLASAVEALGTYAASEYV